MPALPIVLQQNMVNIGGWIIAKNSNEGSATISVADPLSIYS